jgi:hypothetical protein
MTEAQERMQREIQMLNLDLRGVGLSPLWEVVAEITPDGFIQHLYTAPVAAVPERESSEIR